MDDLKNYIAHARENGLDDAKIKELVVDAGWDAHDANRLLLVSEDLIPPKAMAKANTAAAQPIIQPNGQHELTVVSGGFSVRGFEYLIYYITMGASALSISSLLHSTTDELFGTSSIYQSSQSFWIAALVVAMPLFIILMLRLRKAELATPEIKQDSTRRRATQLMMLVTFLVGIGRIIGFVFNVIDGGSSQDPIIEELVHTLITISVAGSIFFPLWLEDRKKSKTQ